MNNTAQSEAAKPAPHADHLPVATTRMSKWTGGELLGGISESLVSADRFVTGPGLSRVAVESL